MIIAITETSPGKFKSFPSLDIDNLAIFKNDDGGFTARVDGKLGGDRFSLSGRYEIMDLQVEINDDAAVKLGLLF